jgi:hypothetical protein
VKEVVVLAQIMVFSTFANLVIGQSKVAYLAAERVKLSKERIADNTISIPYKIVGGHFLVEAVLNQEQGLFILDTGSPSLVVNQEVLRKNIKATGVNDGVMAAETSIDHFRWRDEVWKNLSALALNLEHLEKSNKERILGLIGYDLLRQSELVFDTKHRQIHISDGTEQPLLNGLVPKHSFPISLQDHLPVVVLKIGTQTFRFGIDTGAESNLLDQKCLEKLDASLFHEIGIDRVTGVEGQVRSCKVMEISGVELGGVVPFTVMNLSHLEQLSGLRIDGLIGSDLLNRFAFSINYRKRQWNLWDL